MKNALFDIGVSTLALAVLLFVTGVGSNERYDQPRHWPDCATGQGNISNGSGIVNVEGGAGLPLGSMIAFFADGKCVGQGLYTGQGNFPIAVWRADSLAADKRGFTDGDRLVPMVISEWEAEPDSTFIARPDGIYVLTQLRPLGSNTDDLNRLRELLATSDSLLIVSRAETEAMDVRRLGERRLKDTFRRERDALAAKLDSVLIKANELISIVQ